MITDEELRQIKVALESEVVDDPETWFAINGPELIKEVLEARLKIPELIYQVYSAGMLNDEADINAIAVDAGTAELLKSQAARRRHGCMNSGST